MRLALAISAAALAAAGPAQALDLNVISKVEVGSEGGNVLITIQGTKPPNFTTFSMTDPPRFVIDLSEAQFKDVPEDVVVGDETINLVKNLSYGSAETSIARVMVAFNRDVDPPDVQTSGTALLVRVARPAAPGAAAAAKAEPAPQAQAQAAPAAEAPAKGAAAPAAAAQAAGGAGAAATSTGASAAATGTGAAAGGGAAAGAGAAGAAAAGAGAAAVATSGGGPGPREAAEAERARQEKENQEMLAWREAQKRSEAEAAARKPAGETSQVEVLNLQEQERQKAEADARAREQEERARAAAVAAAPAPPAAEASPPSPAEPEKLAAVDQRPLPAREPLAAPAKRRQLREIGFQQLPEASRVFVKLSDAPAYQITEVGENVVQVELQNTRVKRANDTRFMDTSFFASPVAMVTPKRQGTSYVVEIRLKQKVPWQQKVEGEMLAIDFERPVSMREKPVPAAAAPEGAAPAPGAAPAEPQAQPPAPAAEPAPKSD